MRICELLQRADSFPQTGSLVQKLKMMVGFFVVICACWIGVRWVNSQVRPSHIIGVRDGRFADCPNRPNCVSTQTDNTDQEMEPIPLLQPPGQTIKGLKQIISSMSGSRVVESSTHYLHAEFRSFVFGFVDDVELWVDEDAQVVHFQSASRLGYSDLGVNRNRMQAIRRRYETEAVISAD